MISYKICRNCEYYKLLPSSFPCNACYANHTKFPPKKEELEKERSIKELLTGTIADLKLIKTFLGIKE